MIAKIKQIKSLEDLREIEINDAVEIPIMDARGIVHYLDKTEMCPWIILVERWNEKLCDVMYLFNRGKIVLNGSSTPLQKDVEKYETKLRGAGFIE